MNYPTIQNHDTLKQTVNARDVHKFLEIKRDFSDWIKDQVKRARLVENTDYVTNHLKVERQTLKEYHITLEAAKHIGMMSQSDKGFEVRDYFIDCEKKAQAAQPALPQDFSQALRMLADNVESNAKLAMENEQQRHVIAENKPKVVYANAVLGATNAICVRDWVKTLQTEEGLAWGERKVWRWLEDESYIFRQNKKPRPYAGKAMNYFTLEPIIVATSKGNKEQVTFKVTGVGQIELGAKILQDSKGVIA